MSARVKLSVIIPIFNEEENILVLHKRLKSALDSFKENLELIFINDGSSDNSLSLIKDLASNDSSVRYLSFSRNFGHQLAVTAGLDAATGDVISIIDADLQDPPELIPEMVEKLNEGYQVVYAKRRQRKKESFFKKFTAKMFYRVLDKLSEVEIPLDTGDFRVMDKKVVDVLKQMNEQHKFIRGQIAWIGFKQTYILYDREERYAGKSHYPLKKMLKFAFDGLTSFSNSPLKFATYLGFIVSSLSFLFLIYALISRLFFESMVIRGWTSLMISITFIGGVQLICIGIIGEYVGRIASNVRNRPLYVINESNINKSDG